MKALNGNYRVRPPGKMMLTGTELAGAISNVFPTRERDANCPLGEWYCQSELCVVREVRVYCKLYGEPMPKEMKCPACGETLKFHHWLDSELLLHEVQP